MARTEMLMTFDRATRKVGLRIENGYDHRVALKAAGWEFNDSSAWIFHGTNKEIVDLVAWAMGANIPVIRADGKTKLDAEFFAKMQAAV